MIIAIIILILGATIVEHLLWDRQKSLSSELGKLSYDSLKHNGIISSLSSCFFFLPYSV